MAEKTSTVIVYVDLDCRRCYRRIRKVLCKLQATADQERIRTISYNDKGQMITISGPFDPLQLCSKIRCMGGKVIKDIQIKPPPPPPPPPPTCTCNKDIEQLKMRMEDLLRVCVGNNNDIEQLKQQVDRLLEQDQQISSCADLKRAIQQLEIRMAELHEMLSQKRPKCTGEPQGQKCGMVIIPSSDSCSYLKCHGHCGSPYCRCYASCRFSEEDSAAACSFM